MVFHFQIYAAELNYTLYSLNEDGVKKLNHILIFLLCISLIFQLAGLGTNSFRDGRKQFGKCSPYSNIIDLKFKIELTHIEIQVPFVNRENHFLVQETRLIFGKISKGFNIFCVKNI